MNKMLGIGLNFTFVIGVALCLYSLFENTNYNECFGIGLCVCATYGLIDMIEKIFVEVEDEI